MDEHRLPLPTCTPADVARNLERIKRRQIEKDIGRRLDVIIWNQQMEAAMEVIVAADLAGHGVIIRTSHRRNMIEAVAHETVERHTAFVFDYDRPDSGPFRKRLHIHTTPTQEN